MLVHMFNGTDYWTRDGFPGNIKSYHPTTYAFALGKWYAIMQRYPGMPAWYNVPVAVIPAKYRLLAIVLNLQSPTNN